MEAGTFDRSRSRPRRGNRLGLTLTETLIALAIIVILASILFAVLSGSKVRAKQASEVEALHQLALAGAIYHDECGDWPLSVAPLVERKLTPPGIGLSALDTTVHGMANELAQSIRSECPACRVVATPYRRTFIGPRDYGRTAGWFKQEIESIDGAGWLVSLTESKPTRPNEPADQFNNPSGSYLRVLTNGGIVNRQHKRVVTPAGSIYAIQFMFADGDDAWRKKVAGTP